MRSPGKPEPRVLDVHGEVEETVVRPYTVTGGRTRPSALLDLPVEALVEALSGPELGMTPERRELLDLTATSYQSIAELSAHLRLPVGVVRVVVSDLVGTGHVRVHGPASTTSSVPSTTISVLESVLDGISSL